ncbi:helix-turn-helix domain-containing protein [Citrobacter sp. JGM124]|uniref:helix-turn-helix domain-containing protein n=1 Tax=Citrobacter sp. JGM124 TaxID=2799789 RepID=UPI001BAAF19F|nr:helix-turn-helix domain-containing protein [Citrobacter sp. JGM124]MBS0849280.1 helix-turn-helix domain-containing protein [Citrobacter sp. JGM124]
MNLQKEILSDVIEWIENNLDKKLTMKIVAERSGYSRWHLQRIFSSNMKKTLGCYIRERRLSRASADLVNTDVSIINIALCYGFDTQQEFTRMFSRMYEISPAKWRKEQKRQGNC